MKTLLRSMMFVSVLLGPANVFAQTDRLTLTSVKSGVTTHLILDQVGSDFQGTLDVGTSSSIVFATYSGTAYYVQIGVPSAAINFNQTETSTTYTGIFYNGQSIELEALFSDNKAKYSIDGTVGTFVNDVTGSVSPDNGIKLHWGDKKLALKRTSNGSCSGTIKAKGQDIATLTCTSSGTMTDVLFNNSDQFVGLLMNLFVN